MNVASQNQIVHYYYHNCVSQLVSSILISKLHFSHSVSPSCWTRCYGNNRGVVFSGYTKSNIFFFLFVSKNMQLLCWVGQCENWPVLQIALVRHLWFCTALIIISVVTFVFIFSSNKSSAESFHFSKVIFERH